MLFLVLLATFTLLVKSEPSGISSGDAPDLVVGNGSTARAKNERYYQHVRNSYVESGCVDFFGEFPSFTAAKDYVGGSVNNFIPTRRRRVQAMERDTVTGGMACSCAMLHDLGATAIAAYIQHDGFAAATYAEPKIIGAADCTNGVASGYECKNVDLVTFVPKDSLPVPGTTISPMNANDVWGWTSSDGREYVIWGVEEGVYFVEIKISAEGVVRGFLPSSSGAILQRDIKVIGDYAYIGSESSFHGLQIFDMTKLLEIKSNRDCESEKYCTVLDADGVYYGPESGEYEVGNTHNIVANEESNFLYLVGGTNGCFGGLHIVDVSNPLSPKFVACFGDDGYVHDAHCVNYKGPDPKYQNREICACFNEVHVAIVDVTDKSDIFIISRTEYGDRGYTHQGWFSTDHTQVVFGDEVDEVRAYVKNTRSMILDVRDLSKPTNFREFFGDSKSIDHNQYIAEASAYDKNLYSGTDLIFQANYGDGLRIKQVVDYDTNEIIEVGFFDTFINPPFEMAASFVGAWSVYPYFASGMVAISSIQEGLFIVKPNLENALVAPPNSPTKSPTLAPTAKQTNQTPTRAPTVPNCVDSETLDYKGKGKGCEWVGRGFGNKKKKRRNRRRKCKKIWEGERLYDVCPATCALVGLGSCA